MVRLCTVPWVTASAAARATCLPARRGAGRLLKGESWALAVSLVQLMEPILIQDAEDIIDLNKLSVKEKL